MVMGGDSCSKVLGSNPSAVYWIDIFSHQFAVKLHRCLFEKTENKLKEAKDGPFKKTLSV